MRRGEKLWSKVDPVTQKRCGRARFNWPNASVLKMGGWSLVSTTWRNSIRISASILTPSCIRSERWPCWRSVLLGTWLVAQSLNSLAKLYWTQAKYAEAEPLTGKLLAIVEKVAGPEDPDVAQILKNLAEVYKAQRKYADAEAAHKRALAIRENALGAEDPEVAQSLNNLAELYKVQGRNSEAEPFYKRSWAIAEKVFGPEHPDVATIQEKYAEILRKMNRKAEAEKLEVQAKAIRAKQAKGTP